MRQITDVMFRRKNINIWFEGEKNCIGIYPGEEPEVIKYCTKVATNKSK